MEAAANAAVTMGRVYARPVFKKRWDMNRLDDLIFNMVETFLVLKGKLVELYHKLTEF